MFKINKVQIYKKKFIIKVFLLINNFLDLLKL